MIASFARLMILYRVLHFQTDDFWNDALFRLMIFPVVLFESDSPFEIEGSCLLTMMIPEIDELHLSTRVILGEKIL